MKYNKLHLLWILLFILILAYLGYIKGCEELPVTGNVVQDSGSQDKTVEKYTPPEENQSNGTSHYIPQGGEEETYDTYQPRYEPAGCDNCAQDEMCYLNRCKKVECMSDEDCVDDDPCSIDECRFAGHPNSYCSTEMITRDRNADGCCPEGSWVDDDTDCKPVCGNHKCEWGESVEMCEEDCKNAGPPSGGPAPSSPSQSAT